MKKYLYLALAAGACALAGFTVGYTASGDIWNLHKGGSAHDTPIVQIPVAGTSLLPGTDNDFALGSSTKRWSGIWAYDLTLADDLTVADDLAVTDGLTVGGTSTLQRVTYGLQLSTAPRTSTTLVFNSTGTLVYNSTDAGLCVSTGSNQTSFVASSAPTTACGH